MSQLKSDGEDRINEIQKFVEDWNNQYPIDYWWRKKFNVPFGSRIHQDQSLLDMRIDFEEELYFLRKSHESSQKSVEYEPGTGDWLSAKQEYRDITEDEADDMFDALNIQEFQREDIKEILESEASKDKEDA